MFHVATTYNNLGTVHSDLGNLGQAKECHDRALAIRLEKLGPEHVDVASTYNKLGTVHSDLGNLGQPKECHDRALAIRLEKLGPEHVDVAMTWAKLGQAKEYHDRALAIRLEKLGPGHVDVATTYSNLGTVHSDLGNLGQAKECHDRALAIRLEKLGPGMLMSQPLTTTWVLYTVTWATWGQARSIMIMHWPFVWKSLDLGMLMSPTTYSNLGTVHSDLGNLGQAKECP
ncbi:hypothetical protein OS493_026236 [Desmophyllum pertusum]|uniref:Kinesin light chain n=1 Tax=Desmophyllum pertusum TaxID=174260 RepID=A0A9W9ZLG8_9CNID|nr:hypothetical protein OS493_026236 [Desmophyllum pertusum]